MSNAVKPPNSDCTNFISYALAAGGLKLTEAWNPQNPNGGPWFNSTDLFHFLIDEKIGFTSSVQFNNTSNYRDDSDSKKLSNFLQLRENTTDMKKENGAVDNVWADFVNSSNAQPGDLVFYCDQSWNNLEWSHVAIVTNGITSSTTFDTKLKGPKEPLLVDHDGPTDNNPNWLPRSMGDTDGEYIKSVIVLHAP